MLESFILGGDEEESKNLQVVGNYSFFVKPKVQGFVSVHSSTVSINCYENEERLKAIGFSVKWAKIHNADTYDLSDYTEKHYNISPSDIGLKIRATITATDHKYPGAAYMYIGPIELDLAVRPQIEGYLLHQGCDFAVNVLSFDRTALPPNTCLLSIDRPYLYLKFDPRLNELKESKEMAAKGVFEPIKCNFEQEASTKMRIDNYSTINTNLVFKGEKGQEHKLKIQFDSRFQRDAFYIFLRLLRSIKISFLNKLLSDFDLLLTSEWSAINLDRDEDEDEEFDEPGYNMLLKFDLSRELLRNMVRMNKELNQENSDLVDSVVIIEDELNSSMEHFRALLKDPQSFDDKKLRKLERTNKTMLDETSVIIEDAKHGRIRKNDISMIEQKQEKEQLTKDVGILKKRYIDMKKQLEMFKKLNPEGVESQQKSHNGPVDVGFFKYRYLKILSHPILKRNRFCSHCLNTTRRFKRC